VGRHWGVSWGLAGMLLALYTATRASHCARALSSLSCVFVFSSRVCCLWRHCVVGNACSSARNACTQQRGPHIVRVPCPLYPVCLCSRVECVASVATALSETHAAAPETHAQVPLHALEHAASCMRESALRLRASHWHVCACVQILPGLLTG